MTIVILSIVFGALIGYLVLSALVLVLFYPKREAAVGPLRLQSQFRVHWHAMAREAVVLADSMITEEDLRRRVEAIDIAKEAEPLIDQRMDAFFGDVIKQIPMAAMFLQGTLSESLKKQAKTQLIKLIPELKERMVSKLGESFSPGKMVEEYLESANVGDVERLVQHAVAPHLLRARRFGAAAGAALGLVEGLFLFLVS